MQDYTVRVGKPTSMQQQLRRIREQLLPRQLSLVLVRKSYGPGLRHTSQVRGVPAKKICSTTDFPFFKRITLKRGIILHTSMQSYPISAPVGFAFLRYLRSSGRHGKLWSRNTHLACCLLGK